MSGVVVPPKRWLWAELRAGQPALPDGMGHGARLPVRHREGAGRGRAPEVMR